MSKNTLRANLSIFWCLLNLSWERMDRSSCLTADTALLEGGDGTGLALQSVIARPFQKVFINLHGVLHSSAENLSKLHPYCWLPSKIQRQKIPKSHQRWHQPWPSCLYVLSKQKGLFEENQKNCHLLWALHSVFKRRWK